MTKSHSMPGAYIAEERYSTVALLVKIALYAGSVEERFVSIADFHSRGYRHRVYLPQNRYFLHRHFRSRCSRLASYLTDFFPSRIFGVNYLSSIILHTYT